MKISSNPAVEGFKPVSLTFVFESQAELDAFGQMFNSGWVVKQLYEVAPSLEGTDIWKRFEGLGAKVSPTFK